MTYPQKHDLESEKAQEFNDLVEAQYRNLMRNLTAGDMRDLLEKMMDNRQYLVSMLHILVFTKDAQALLHHHERLLKEMMMELAEREAEKEVG